MAIILHALLQSFPSQALQEHGSRRDRSTGATVNHGTRATEIAPNRSRRKGETPMNGAKCRQSSDIAAAAAALTTTTTRAVGGGRRPPLRERRR